MDKISVNSDIHYEVTVGCDWRECIAEIFERHAKVLIIAPKFIADAAALEFFCDNESRILYVSSDGEAQKDIAVVESIWGLLGAKEFGRESAIVAIGGGATTDLGGFVAATWLRGISWYAMPTTLAGMVDASVGGKTGINSNHGKNMIGSFYSPRAVYADISWLDSLSDRDFSAGLAEVIKTGFISDGEILNLLDSCSGIQAAREIAEALVTLSVKVKADVVSQDFKESKLREILNFGHTFGHAIEKLSHYSLRHGEAVSIGLYFEALLSESVLGFTSAGSAHLKLLLQKFHLPIAVKINDYVWSEIHSLMMSDKKSRDGHIRSVGLVSVGEPGWIENADAPLLKQIYERIVE